jgi:hypothetical protein
MVKKAVQQGRSERGVEAYFFSYVETPSNARTPLEVFFTILLIHALGVGDVLKQLLRQLAGDVEARGGRGGSLKAIHQVAERAVA